ncbi:MAG: Hsp20/alpha crystallin family protein [Kiritimatiellae bacterium]|nr:Hsp20/alpha crystallin family protein [Kiritimatiellia bacterium]
MSENKVVPKSAPEVQSAPVAENKRVFLPDVDVIESSEQLKLFADMPGVDKTTVEVLVENNVLSITGEPMFTPPEGGRAAGTEFCLGRYYREFTLSNDIDTTAVKASVRNGVLELTLPKKEEVKKRVIEISSAG